MLEARKLEGWDNGKAEQAEQDAHGSLRLWAHVLLQAVHDARGHVKALNHGDYSFNRRSLITGQAREWFQSKDTGMGSFLWICDLFGLDPDAVRAAVLHGARSEGEPLRFSTLLLSRRREKGLTQKGLAGKLGVSSRAIQNWENGRCKPRRALMGLLTRVLEDI